MADLSESEIEEVREVFDLFDYWDGRDGLVDATKIPDFMRCLGLNPTNEVCKSASGLQENLKEGEKQFKFEEILPIFKVVSEDKDTGTFADFMEAMKTFDREGLGFISSAELRNVLTAMGERLTDGEVDFILKHTETHEDIDGNIKYEEFIKKVLAGPDTK